MRIKMMVKRSIIHMALVAAAVLALTATIGAAGGKKFSENISRSLFSDRRAYQVGDVVTILIVEYSSGEHEAGTETDSDNQFGGSATGSGDLSDINYGASAGWNNKFDGSGNTKREGSLEATISARIVEITDTGNLVIEGERTIIVNGEKQITKLRGMVRPEDISGQNTVFSYRIADAQITYTGKGDVNSAQKPGWITRIINWIF
jgi:flagellar L-ring protein precursor FlgH